MFDRKGPAKPIKTDRRDSCRAEHNLPHTTTTPLSVPSPTPSPKVQPLGRITPHHTTHGMQEQHHARVSCSLYCGSDGLAHAGCIVAECVLSGTVNVRRAREGRGGGVPGAAQGRCLDGDAGPGQRGGEGL